MSFFGMRGSGSWSASERPENWRQTVLYLYPNGAAPLTAMLSKMKNEQTDDPHYHWFTKTLQEKGTAVAGMYTDINAATAVIATDDVASGGVIYPKVSTDFAKQLRIGHIVLLRDTSLHASDCRGIVVNIVRETGVVAVKMLETATNLVYYVDRLLIIGNANAEGASRPEAISYDVSEFGNYTQIFRTALDITRTAQKTKYRTGDKYKDLKKEALEDHSIEMEYAFLHGIKTLGTGDNGQPQRTTQGMIPFIRENAPTNVIDPWTDTSVAAGADWVDYGEAYLDSAIEKSFRFGKSNERLVYLSNYAMLAIQRVVKANGTYQLNPNATAYGIKVQTLETVFGAWHLKTHPLFTQEASTATSLLAFDPSTLIYRYVDDTFFKADDDQRSGGNDGIDGKREEFLTEAGLEMHIPESAVYISNIGTDKPA